METRRIDGDRLEGVSATTLWTLYNRAEEAKRPDAYIDDPFAVALYDTIDYDYPKFGKVSQTHPPYGHSHSTTSPGATSPYTRRRRWSHSGRGCRPVTGAWAGPRTTGSASISTP